MRRTKFLTICVMTLAANVGGCSNTDLTGGGARAIKSSNDGVAKNPIYLPLGGSKDLPGVQLCTSADASIAAVGKGTVTGEKVGETKIDCGGKSTPVIVYDPKNPPPGVGASDGSDGEGGSSGKANSGGTGTQGGTTTNGSSTTGSSTSNGTTTNGSGSDPLTENGSDSIARTSTLTITMNDTDAHLPNGVSVTVANQQPMTMPWAKNSTKTFPSMCVAHDVTTIAVTATNEGGLFHNACVHTPGSQYAQVSNSGTTATMIMDRDCGTEAKDFTGERAVTMTFSCEQTKAVTLTP